MSRVTATMILAGAVLFGAACGSGDGGSAETPEPRTATTRAATSTPRPSTAAVATAEGARVTPGAPASTSAPAAPGSSSGAGAAPPAPPPPAPPNPGAPPPNAGAAYTAAQGTAQVNAGTLTPTDLSGAWVVQTDTPVAAAPPEAAGCGWLASRTVSNLPQDVVGTFLNGGTLSFFTNVTAYETEAGALECAARAVQRFAAPGELARAFQIFVDPDAVVVTPFSYPQIADGSISWTLTGQVNANGTIVDITLLVVAYREGNVSGVVGSARSGAVPPPEELTPLINLVLGRVAANQ